MTDAYQIYKYKGIYKYNFEYKSEHLKRCFYFLFLLFSLTSFGSAWYVLGFDSVN